MSSTYNEDEADNTLSNVVGSVLTQVIISTIDEIAGHLKNEVKKSFQNESL
jgi:ubiquinone biosynthesis protein UbiJ